MSIFRYEVSLTYINKDTEYLIDSKHIHSLVMDYDYTNKNRPMVFVIASIDKNILDKMIKNKDTDKVILSVNKYDKDNQFKVSKKYIKDEYIYFLPDDLNYNKGLDYSGTEVDSEDKFKKVTIGLMNSKLIDMNKVLVNEVVRNTSLLNLIAKHLTCNKLLIDPFDYNPIINNFIIPPITTLTGLLKYLNTYYPIYTTKYRLFFDNDKTYLVSSSGKGVPSKQEEYNSVIINVRDTVTELAKYQGMFIDKKTNSYILDIDSNDISVYKSDNMINKNTIIGIDSNGKTNKNILKKEKTEKVVLEKVQNVNSTNISKSELTIDTFINIVKSDIDTSLFTLNKEYNIKNYNNLKENDGKYILLRKREVYSRQENEFIVSCVLSMKKVNPSV